MPIEKKIVDELCDCGHLMTEHNALPGHEHLPGCHGGGPCGVCNCIQFTWVDFLYEEG